MLAQGVSPNLVTYNTLLEAHACSGAWAEALRVLDALRHRVSEGVIGVLWCWN